MRKSFQLKNGYINLICNESLEYCEYERECHREVISWKPYSIVPNITSIVLELERHVGPRILYGMLVMDISEINKGSEVTLLVSYTKENSVKHDTPKFSYRYEGLPYEYLEGVKSGVKEYLKEAKGFPCCEIFVSHGVNCEEGSSVALYEMLTKAMLHIIADCSCEDITQMTAEEFSGKYLSW